MSETIEKKALVPKLRFPEFSGDDASSWSVRSLSDSVCGIKAGSSAEQRTIDTGYPVTRIETIADGTVDFARVGYIDNFPGIEGYRINDGDILLSNINSTEHIGKSVRFTSERHLYHGMNLLRVIPDPSKIFSEFLHYQLSTERVRSDLRARSNKAVNQASIDQTAIGKTLLYTPSLPEQRKIADCLQSLGELIAAQTEKLEALKRHKKGLLQQLFPAEGETTPRLRFPKFRNDGPWETTTLRSVATISSGTTPSRSNKAFFDGGTIPWVKTMDLNNSEIRSTHERVTKESGVKVNPAGSVLVAMYGGFNQIGRTGILIEPSATNQAIAVLTPKPGEITSAYLLLWLNANVETWKRVAASSRKDANITSADVASFSITVPRSEEEQSAIGEAVGALAEALSEAYLYIEELRTHKASLMQQLFPQVEELGQ